MEECANSATEADVETKTVLPLLLDGQFLAIERKNLRSKEYLAPTALDKKAGKNIGYYPDYAFVAETVPIAVVEVKKPSVAAEAGFREAAIYAAHLNRQYPPGVNPVQRILAVNGQRILAGAWDSEPLFNEKIADIFPGSDALQRLRAVFGHAALDALYNEVRPRIRPPKLYVPYVEAQRVDALNATISPNTFAAPLGPALKRYLTSNKQNTDPDIYGTAYVEEKQLSDYDAALDAMMREKIVELRGSLTENLDIRKEKEPHLERIISDFQENRPHGEIQLITGSVGTGKSLFIRRYKELLQNPELSKISHWAFIDFNAAKTNDAEKWIAEKFIDSFQSENAFDPYDRKNQDRIFAKQLNQRRAVYEELAETSLEASAQMRASDKSRWLDEPQIVAEGICRYFLGDKRETIIVVMDNVDRKSTEEQLQIFRLSLWFLDFTRSFIILSLRDDTYERYRNIKPMDTFRTGLTFHVPPPRFIDIVKRRVELIGSYLAKGVPDRLTYSTSGNLNFTYPKTLLGEFLKEIYLEIFDEQRNVGKFIQGIAGRDVRKALEIFDSILRSGHLTEEVITSRLRGAGEFEFSEDILLRALMRGERALYSNSSGFVSNIFYCSEDWDRPNSFLVPDMLYLLYAKRREKGTMGIEGYFSLQSIAQLLEPCGYTENDAWKAADYLVSHGLVESDKLHDEITSWGDNLKITYSGFVHLRFLADRVEYLSGVLSVTPLADSATASRIGSMVVREIDEKGVTLAQRVQAVEAFYRYLDGQYKTWVQWFPGFSGRSAGASYALNSVERAVRNVRNGEQKGFKNPLDTL